MTSLTLEHLEGGKVIGKHVLRKQRRRVHKIGRLAASDVQIDDPGVARLHATIDLSMRRPLLRHLGGEHATAINGHRVQRATLKQADVIEIGDTRLRVCLPDPKKRPPPIPKAGEREREALIDKVATLTPYSADQLAHYADFLRAQRKQTPKRRKPKGAARRRLAQPKSKRVCGAPAPRGPDATLDTGFDLITPATSQPRAAKRPLLKKAAAGPRPQQLIAPGWLLSACGVAMAVFAITQGTGVMQRDFGILSAGPKPTSDADATTPAASPAAKGANAEAAAAGSGSAAALAAASTPLADYTVRPGDTLGVIARRTLGDVSQWRRIQAANPVTLNNPSRIEVGMVLKIPAP